MSITGVMIAVTALGLPQATIYYIGKNEIDFKEMFPIFLNIVALCGLLLLFLYLSFSEEFIGLINGNQDKLILILVLLIYAVKLTDYFFISYVRAIKNFTFYNIRRIAEALLFLFLVIFILGIAYQGIRSILIIYLLVGLISMTVLVVFVIRISGFKRLKLRFNKKTLKKMFGFGAKSYLQNLTGFLNFQVSVLLLAWLSDSYSVGIFSVGVSMAAVFLFIPDTIGTVLLPHLTSKHTDAEIHNLTAMIVRNMLSILIIVVILFSIIGKHLIHFLYGIEYSGAFYPMLIMLPGIFFLSIYKILTRNFTSRNKQHYVIIVGMILLIINLLLNYSLIKLLGINGAAFSSTCSFILSGLILIIIFKKESGISYKEILIPGKTDIHYFREIWLKIKAVTLRY